MPDSFFLMSQGKNVKFCLHDVSAFLRRVSGFYIDYAADYDADKGAAENHEAVPQRSQRSGWLPRLFLLHQEIQTRSRRYARQIFAARKRDGRQAERITAFSDKAGDTVD